MYVITGATSRTGSVVANYLIEKGQPVRVLGRNAERLSMFADKGVEVFVVEPTDQVALTEAFTGAKAVYVMLQPNYIATSNDFRAFQDRIMDAIMPALEKAKVKYVVSLSSWGADKPEGTGPVAGLHQLEQCLNRIAGLNVLHIRPGYFMENTLSQIDNILARNAAAGPFSPNVKFPFIATRDVGLAVGEALLKLNFQGKQSRELHGNQDLTMLEVATMIGKAIQQPSLTYVQDSKERTRRDLLDLNFSEHIIQLILEVADAMNAGHIQMLEPRSADNSTPTSYEKFVYETLLPLYKQKGIDS
ncbi:MULTISPECIES: NAD(P)H-binding protein [Pelosinus]|uniref:NmrA family protein n=1 Tax=Pelosinus fermentans B4 TaxID=1149862 RepID=I8RDY5_9FIRM|nr:MULTISPECIES: NAD(P)H-binding protein [Pelosinus]EIW15700.1 NmrA family protein [Pelosinus fermentans B4]EIW26610.1 NmrA family protein [Pelosinus fermentans A11]